MFALLKEDGFAALRIRLVRISHPFRACHLVASRTMGDAHR